MTISLHVRDRQRPENGNTLIFATIAPAKREDRLRQRLKQRMRLFVDTVDLDIGESAAIGIG